MRCELSGYSGRPEPLLLNLINEVPFLKASYVDLGYTNYDVMCIGGAGGNGGGANAFLELGEFGELVNYRVYGGGGGGGGVHRVRGLLSGLPSSSPVIVGSAGAEGHSLSTPQYNLGGMSTQGESGGASSFNGSLCQASGGRGGKESYPEDATRYGKGGDGGIGGASGDGGGGIAGNGAFSSYYGLGLDIGPGEDGTWDGEIGQGGGGGGAGYLIGADGGSATLGGRGAFSLSDTTVFGPGGILSSYFADPYTEFIVPGAGGGAKAAPINLQSTVYGSKVPGSTPNGAVIILLTQI